MCCRRKYLSSHCQFPNVLQAQIFLVTVPITKCAASTSTFRHLANSPMGYMHKYFSSTYQLPPSNMEIGIPYEMLG